MKVLLLLAKGFEHMESAPFIDVMGWARMWFDQDIHVHTCGFERTVNSAFDAPLLVDRIIDDIDVDDYDAIAIPGGRWDFGFFDEAFDPTFQNLIQAFAEKDKIIASVCIAALALGKSGILKGKDATTYHLDGGKAHEELRGYGANVVDESVVIDGRIVTSYGPETAAHVAFSLLEMLTDCDLACKVMKAMCY